MLTPAATRFKIVSKIAMVHRTSRFPSRLECLVTSDLAQTISKEHIRVRGLSNVRIELPAVIE